MIGTDWIRYEDLDAVLQRVCVCAQHLWRKHSQPPSLFPVYELTDINISELRSTRNPQIYCCCFSYELALWEFQTGLN